MAITVPSAFTSAASFPVDGRAFTSAKLAGLVDRNGGEACEYRFRYKVAGGSYSYTDWAGSVGGEGNMDGCFAETIEVDSKLVYYFNAQVKNTAGESEWGAERAIARKHGIQHAITSTDDHTSEATEGQMLQGDANGLPVDATLSDDEIVAVAAAAHTQLCEAADFTKLDGIEAGADKTDATNVDAAGAVMESDTDYVDKTHLSQDFGASAGRLRNMIMTPIAGEILRITNCSGSCFTGVINAGGSGGLTTTNVPYDGDSEENMFSGLFAYDGSDYWGQIILHNTDKGNSRNIVSVDRTNNVITTTSSTDDWADDDVITTESQTNTGGAQEYFDIDISDNIGTSADAVVLVAVMQNNTVNNNSNNNLYVHPYETYALGKRQWLKCAVANECSNMLMVMPVISQKITVSVHNGGVDDFYVILSCVGKIEYADT